MLFDYRVTETKFGGPNLFSRGDTSFFNQLGELIRGPRSTSIRYNPENARRLDTLGNQKDAPQWTDSKLARLEEEKFAYCRTIDGHVLRDFDSVRLGEALPLRPIGPHSIQSFTTEWRSFIFTVWGAQCEDEIACAQRDPSQIFHDVEKARIDPGYADGLYAGPSRRTCAKAMRNKWGSRAVMATAPSWAPGCWTIWPIGPANSAWSFIPMCATLRSLLTGDVTYLTARINRVARQPDRRHGIIWVDVEMKNQDRIVIGRGSARRPPAPG